MFDNSKDYYRLMLTELQRLENLSDEYKVELRYLSKVIRRDFWTKYNTNLLCVLLNKINNVYDLSDEATVNEVIDSRAFSDFCGVESSDQVPDGDTLGRFRNLLIKNDLREKLFKQVVELLTKRGLILKKGSVIYV